MSSSRERDYDVTLRPARRRSRDGGASALRLRRASARAWIGHRSSRRPARLAYLGLPRLELQRSVVKVSYLLNGGGQPWRAHGRYLAREGAQTPDRPGLGFDASTERIDLAGRLDAWQRAGDPRLWKLVVSPERGDRLDLRRHTRDLLAAMEGDLGRRLEWVAIEHHDTAHPHTHVALRGRDAEGRALRLTHAYVTRGIRDRSQELATRSLGLRGETDRLLARERAVRAQYFGVLDRALEAGADEDRRVLFDALTPERGAAREARLQMLRRLEILRDLGLAERLGKRTWRLSEHHRPALRLMQSLGDIQQSLARGDIVPEDLSAPLRLSHLAPGSELRGRLLRVATDPEGGRRYVALEGTDGFLHLVPVEGEIAFRASGRPPLGQVVTVRSLRHRRDQKASARLEIGSHGMLEALVAKGTTLSVLDLDAVRAVRMEGAAPEPVPVRGGFFARYREALRSRLEPLIERGLLVRTTAKEPHRTRQLAVALDAEERIEMAIRERERRPLSFAEAEKLGGKTLRAGVLETRQVYRGRVVAMAEDGVGQLHVVVDTGRHLTAIPASGRDFTPGREVRAEAVAVATDGSTKRRAALAWQLDELEQARKRGHERDR